MLKLKYKILLLYITSQFINSCQIQASMSLLKILAEEVLQTLKKYGQRYAYLVPLLRSSSSSEFYRHLISIDHLDHQQTHKQLQLYHFQAKNICFLINKKLETFDMWDKVEFNTFFKSILHLHHQIGFVFQYKLIHNKCPNIFDALKFIEMPIKQMSKVSKKLRNQFLRFNINALYKQQVDKTYYNSKCLLQMNEEQKMEFELASVKLYSRFVDRQNTKYSEALYHKHLHTDSEVLFSLLLDLQCPMADKIKQQILGLKLERRNSEWQLTGDCSFQKHHLTKANMIKVFYDYLERYCFFDDNIFTQNQEGIILKYDITDFQMEQIQFAGLTPQSTQQIVKNFEQSLKKIALLMDKVISAKQIFIFNKTLEKVTKEKIELLLSRCIKFTTKMISLRGYSNIILNILPSTNIKAIVCQIKQKYLKENTAISQQFLNNLCRFLQSLKLFSTQSQYLNLGLHFLQFLNAYLNQNQNSEFLPYTSQFLLKLFATPQLPKQKIQENINVLYKKLFTFMLKITQQVKQASIIQMGILQNFLIQNPQFYEIIYPLWIQEVTKMQNNLITINDWRKKHKPSILAQILIESDFQASKQIAIKFKDMLSIDFLGIFSQEEQQKFLKKIGNVNYKQQITSCILQIQVLITDDLQMLKKYPMIGNNYDQDSKTIKLIHLVERLQAFLSLPNLYLGLSLIQKIAYIASKLRIMYILHRQQFQKRVIQLSIQQFQYLMQTESRKYDPLDVFKSKIQQLERFLVHTDNSLVNAIIIGLGFYMKYLMDNYQNSYVTTEILRRLKKILQIISFRSKCQYFPQFYNHHKEMVNFIIQCLIEHNDFKFQKKDYSNKQSTIKFCWRLKQKEKVSINQQERRINQRFKINLKKQTLVFVRRLFTFDDWKENIVVNDIKYYKANKYLIKKSIDYQLISYILKEFKPQRLSFINCLFQAISHKVWKNQSPSKTQQKISVKLPSKLLIIFRDYQHLKQFNNIVKELVKTLYLQQYQKDAIKRLIDLLESWCYNYRNIKNIIFKQLTQELTLLLLNYTQQETFYRVHSAFVIIFKSVYTLTTQLSKQFLHLYIKRIILNLQNKCFNKQNAYPFIFMVASLILSSPSSRSHQEQFQKYTKLAVSIFLKLFQCLSQLGDLIGSIIKRMIAYKLQGRQMVKLYSAIKTCNLFAQIFCEHVEEIGKQFKMASIEHQIKLYLLKNSHDQKGGVKLASFAITFSDKYKNSKSDFIKVAESITKKKILKQEESNTTYIILNENQSFEYCTYLGKLFIDINLNKTMMSVLSNFIKRQTKDKGEFSEKLKQLSTIAFNYPLLSALIMMHPYNYNDVTITFIDYLFNVFIQEAPDEEAYQYLAYFFLNPAPLFKFDQKPICFSEYLCYKLIAKCIEQQLSRNILLLIFYMAKIQIFANLCFKKVKNQISLCDKLWEYLRKNRQNFVFQDQSNTLIYAILSLIYKQNQAITLKKYSQFIQMKREHLNCQPIQFFKQQNIKHQLMNKRSYKQLQDYICCKAQNKQCNIYPEENYQLQYFNVEQIIRQQLKYYITKNFPKYIIKPLNDNKKQQQIFKKVRNCMSTQNKKESIQYGNHILLHDRKFSQQSSDNQREDIYSYNQKHNHQLKANRQSKYAPLDNVAVTTNNYNNNDNVKQGLEQQLSKKLAEIKVNQFKTNLSNVSFTSQMMSILNLINEKLSLLQKKSLRCQDIAGNTLEQKKQNLTIKDLEVDFDYKQATLSAEQFAHFCLANACKLDRLNSERRNIVRSIEDVALLRFVQRSTSSDSVGYIIDTIEENYQLLANKSNDKVSGRNYNKRKPNLNLVPKDYFEQITDANLHELIISLYYNSYLLSDYFLPFVENKRVQKQIILEIIDICKNPFQNEKLPKHMYVYNTQLTRWDVVQDSSQSILLLRKKVSSILYSFGLNSSFREFYDSLEIQQSLTTQIQRDILQLAFLSELNRIYDRQFNNFFYSLKDVQTLTSQQLQRLISSLKKIQQWCKNQTIKFKLSSQDIRKITKQAKYLNQNLKSLLKDQSIKLVIKKAFPLSQPGRDPLFIILLMKTGIYTADGQFENVHKSIFQSYSSKYSPAYRFLFCVGLSLYSQKQLQKKQWLLQDKQQIIRRQIINNIPSNLIDQYFKSMPLLFRTAVMGRKINQYRETFSLGRTQNIKAQRKNGIFESAFIELRNKPDSFWFCDYYVKFIRENGQIESGFGPGVKRDWYSLVTKEMVNLNYGIFMKTSKNYYFFNRQSWINPRHLQYLQFIGKLFALSILNDQLFVTPSFSILLYKMILGEKIQMSDIIDEFDQGEVINNIEKLRQYHDNDMFCQTFIYEDKRIISNKHFDIMRKEKSIENQLSKSKKNSLYLIKESVEMVQQQQPPSRLTETKVSNPNQQYIHEAEDEIRMIKVLKVGETIQLIPQGANVPVNLENRERFIELTKNKIYDIIVSEVKPQFTAFMNGFRHVIKPNFIKNITAVELRQMVQGSSKISIEDLKQNVNVDQSLISTPQVQWLWNCLQGLSAEDKMHFIQHWTGRPKIPAEGFNNQRLSIIKGYKGDRLFAQTCSMRLHLPLFQNKEKLETTVLMAINSIKFGQSIIQD